jgi:hypothetical protein
LGPTPQSAQSCSGQQLCQYTFDTSEWSPCSAACGWGEQTRQVRCTSAAGETVADDLCVSAKAIKPVSKQACKQPPCGLALRVLEARSMVYASAAARGVPFVRTMLLVPLLVLCAKFPSDSGSLKRLWPLGSHLPFANRAECKRAEI